MSDDEFITKVIGFDVHVNTTHGKRLVRYIFPEGSKGILEIISDDGRKTGKKYKVGVSVEASSFKCIFMEENEEYKDVNDRSM